MADSTETLLETPLASLHRELGARMVPFAGYAMPVQYPAGIMAEHLATRSGAGLFDVSHMGQAELVGEGAAEALERLTPADVKILKPGRQKYGLLTTESGGVLDDFMVANLGDRLFLVLNASRKDVDCAAIEAVLPAGVRLNRLPDRALVAFQGPGAVAALATIAPDVSAMRFMDVLAVEIAGITTLVSRSGYTGEDGVEISVSAEEAEELARALLALPGAVPAGLGARDSLRLEAGLCLYGNDIDETTSPVEANLVWTIGKRRRTEWNFPGAERVREELDNGPKRLRVGILPEGRQPARGHTPIQVGGEVVGEVTSGGFGPSLNGPCAMGYVAREHAADGTALDLMVRGKASPARVAPTPFFPHRYAR
ncbi:glycine cleavage system aminomethyltransferase GcvT [Pseudoroseomonas wenyumeiae]|uniref:aminomethyltransferase n=1 Tax=Teichococcus wenyumeiae TaxID=2478470 RepID=A0A3A9JT53_9PROT|nr:glycine cleavage system aminomethyltransferase GcvT [Pseudoroseomonas wenyumeiae]RKK03898.1 glycine cleavage system aminomethyltransferase GcvT [Pseudoroseomonas wenyumeiae]RMI24886.1 glycine cleavage system aminomethyltransferase GcvT [Pseudoroseomonas wenyumeiae]